MVRETKEEHREEVKEILASSLEYRCILSTAIIIMVLMIVYLLMVIKG